MIHLAVVLSLLFLALVVAYSSRLVGGWASVLGKHVLLPPLDGRIYIVTGGSRGVGWQVALIGLSQPVCLFCWLE